MNKEKIKKYIFPGGCLLTGLVSALVTRSIITGIGVGVLIFISWGMLRYVQTISKKDD